MVYKKSEYQNRYKASVIKKYQDVYLENLTLRNERRDREFMHTPLFWEDPVEEECGNSSDSNDEASKILSKQYRPSEPEEQYHSMAEILSDSKVKSEAFRKKKREGSENPLIIPDFAKISLESDPLNLNSDNKERSEKKSAVVLDKARDDKDVLKRVMDHPFTDEEAERSLSKEIETYENTHLENMRNSQFNLRNKTYSKKKRNLLLNSREQLSVDKNGKPKSFVRGQASSSQHDVHVPRLLNIDSDHLADSSKPKRNHPSSRPPSCVKPPFASYGIGDREESLSNHRTYNVRSLTDVYPTAVKAKTRRDLYQKKQKEKVISAHTAEALLHRLTSSAPRDMADWQSEYTKQFHGYEPKEYERAISARAVIPRSTPIPGVHRGGCLVVHVN
ncbi:unnamed protein product [Lymnaea stagnalis]|uniref:Nuclear protein MDM1 n=1 Tax=Lymnaea stagnalis TaxID=6523 RepID=A0AAV2I088_LYMST